MDCLERLDYKRVNTRVLEQLIRCGAFDWTGHPRSALRAGLEGAMSVAQRTQADKASGQVSLFGALMGGGASPPKFKVPDVPEWSTAKRLAFEKEALGFFISGHPVQAFVAEVKRYATCTIDQLAPQVADSRP